MKKFFVVLLLGFSVLAHGQEKPKAQDSKPVITKEILEGRLKDLDIQEQQAVAQANAIHGRILEVQDMLNYLKDQEAKAEPKKEEKK